MSRKGGLTKPFWQFIAGYVQLPRADVSDFHRIPALLTLINEEQRISVRSR